ncbi:MAG: Response regulator containing a CheY-like receiver domain and a GGDEF domain [Methanocalculus sp. 52_23]|nr:MAG: Response regulator containing a CheY-like receiver domain and a GGDEF domain [Methanocalculus sp. 52_23]
MNHNQTHLLVVEDSPTQAEYIRRILQREGFIVSVASDGRAALEALENDTFDLVISDIIMPGMGGYELCQQIKEKSSIPVVLVTQLFDPEDIIRGLASGADGFIIKPFDPVSLLDTITNMLESEEDGRIVLDGDLIIATPGDQTYTISSDRKTILRILLSTYATAVNKNMELQEARDELYGMNEQLQEYVEELRQTNDELHQEMIERQRMEKEVSDAHRKLQLMTTITRDDIRNQLTIIEGYLELLSSGEEDCNYEEIMDRIRQASRRIGRIIEFTRDFQKIGMEEEEWLDLSSVVDAARRMMDMKGITILTEVHGIEIFADSLFERVFGIIFDNTIQHGEKVTSIRISDRMEDTSLVIRIEDDGTGIPDVLKSRIFEQGFGRNTGLGLFLARDILSTCSCCIHECGMPGEGAVFEITVPEGRFRFS